MKIELLIQGVSIREKMYVLRERAVVAVNLLHFVVLLDAHDLPLEGLIICPFLQALQVVKMCYPVVSDLKKRRVFIYGLPTSSSVR